MVLKVSCILVWMSGKLFVDHRKVILPFFKTCVLLFGVVSWKQHLLKPFVQVVFQRRNLVKSFVTVCGVIGSFHDYLVDRWQLTYVSINCLLELATFSPILTPIQNLTWDHNRWAQKAVERINPLNFNQK